MVKARKALGADGMLDVEDAETSHTLLPVEMVTGLVGIQEHLFLVKCNSFSLATRHLMLYAFFLSKG